MMWLPVIGLDRHTPLIGLCIQPDPEASGSIGGALVARRAADVLPADFGLLTVGTTTA